MPLARQTLVNNMRQYLPFTTVATLTLAAILHTPAAILSSQTWVKRHWTLTADFISAVNINSCF